VRGDKLLLSGDWVGRSYLNENENAKDDLAGDGSGPTWIDVRSGLTGPIPTELGNLQLLEYACAPRPPNPLVDP
jgi:hypothetical protein